MPKKKDKELSDVLAELLADPIANYDLIDAAINVQWERLVTMRDTAQDALEWMLAMKRALQMNKLKSLDK